jgi:hypothetical protein
VVVLVVQVQTFQATVRLDLLHQQQSPEPLVQTDQTSMATVVVEVPVVEVLTVELGLQVVETVPAVAHPRVPEHH